MEIVSTSPRPTLAETRPAASAEDEREKLRARCEELQKKAAQQAGQLEEAYVSAVSATGGSGLVASALHHHRRKSDEALNANSLSNGRASAARLSRWGGAMPTARFSLRSRSHQQLGGQNVRMAGSTTTSPSPCSTIDDGALKGKNVSFHDSARQEQRSDDDHRHSTDTDDGWEHAQRSDDDDDDDTGQPTSPSSINRGQDQQASTLCPQPGKARVPASVQASCVLDDAERVTSCPDASSHEGAQLKVAREPPAANPSTSSSMPVDESSVEQLEHLVAMQAYQLKRRSIEAKSMPSEFRRAFSSSKLDTGLIAQVLVTPSIASVAKSRLSPLAP